MCQKSSTRSKKKKGDLKAYYCGIYSLQDIKEYN